MIIGLDTDVLVHWANRSASHHAKVRRYIRSHQRAGRQLGVTPQVLLEFVHVVTDPKRVGDPLSTQMAGQIAYDLWHAQEMARILPGPKAVGRTMELLTHYKLGRERLMDAALAAALEEGGVKELITLSPDDFKVFPFLKTLDPTS